MIARICATLLILCGPCGGARAEPPVREGASLPPKGRPLPALELGLAFGIAHQTHTGLRMVAPTDEGSFSPQGHLRVKAVLFPALLSGDTRSFLGRGFALFADAEGALPVGGKLSDGGGGEAMLQQRGATAGALLRIFALGERFPSRIGIGFSYDGLLTSLEKKANYGHDTLRDFRCMALSPLVSQETLIGKGLRVEARFRGFAGLQCKTSGLGEAAALELERDQVLNGVKQVTGAQSMANDTRLRDPSRFSAGMGVATSLSPGMEMGAALDWDRARQRVQTKSATHAMRWERLLVSASFSYALSPTIP